MAIAGGGGGRLLLTVFSPLVEEEEEEEVRGPPLSLGGGRTLTPPPALAGGLFIVGMVWRLLTGSCVCVVLVSGSVEEGEDACMPVLVLLLPPRDSDRGRQLAWLSSLFTLPPFSLL